MNFVDAVRDTETLTTTENGMPALESSLRAITDLFFKVGSNRGKNLTSLLEKAYQEDQDITMRMVQYVRDVRGGMGERQMFHDFIRHLEAFHPESITPKFIMNVPVIGRYKDLFAFSNSSNRTRAFTVLAKALVDGNQLAAKWCPRKGKDAEDFRKFLGLSPKSYRKLIVSLTNVVETKMCAKEWDKIEYSHVPSLAMTRYTKAFGKNDQARFEAYKESLTKGETKINAAAVYPYQVIKTLNNDPVIATEMWKALPNYMTDANVLPMVDVSGSMATPASGIKEVYCLEIAISLGLYCSDKNRGPFKDLFLTFSSNPKMEYLKGDIKSKLHQMSRSEWGMSTNIQSAFEEILRVAVSKNVDEVDMPKILLILSDMQFDSAGGNHYKQSAIEMIRGQYAEAGYRVPALVFWNLAGDRGTNDNVPVRFDENGTALVSGFSPSIMQAILSADLDKFSPENIVRQAVMIDRYDWK